MQLMSDIPNIPMLKAELPIDQWNAALQLISQGPWHVANPIMMALQNQLGAQAQKFEQEQAARRAAKVADPAVGAPNTEPKSTQPTSSVPPVRTNMKRKR
jgi:hypothetical protein